MRIQALHGERWANAAPTSLMTSDLHTTDFCTIESARGWIESAQGRRVHSKFIQTRHKAALCIAPLRWWAAQLATYNSKKVERCCSLESLSASAYSERAFTFRVCRDVIKATELINKRRATRLTAAALSAAAATQFESATTKTCTRPPLHSFDTHLNVKRKGRRPRQGRKLEAVHSQNNNHW